MGKFHQFLTELSARDTSVFSFLDDKYQWIFTKLGMCIGILEICFGIANGQIFVHFLTELSIHNTSIFWFPDNNFSKSQRIFTKLDMYIDIVEICFGIAHWQISSIFDRVICPHHDNGRYFIIYCVKLKTLRGLQKEIFHYLGSVM